MHGMNNRWPCGRGMARPLNRRSMLARCAQGFGAVAFSALNAVEGRSRPLVDRSGLVGLHHPARARAIIFLYMDGGPSQVDTFDPKPFLDQYNGRNPAELFKVEPTQFNNVGKVLASPWKFKPRGQSGLPISDLFPHLSTHADKLCVVRSMVAKFPEHTSGNYFLHTGSGLQGRPSWGAWLSYGLGSFNRDLPGFMVLNGGLIPPGGLDNFNSGFLPSAHQASVLKAGKRPVANIAPVEGRPGQQRAMLDLASRLDGEHLQSFGSHPELEAAIANQETAFRMQASVPVLMDVSAESAATKRLYGMDSDYEPTRIYGQQCLLARRLVEQGARFIEITCHSVGHDRWDQHSALKDGHEKNCRAVDQPIAGLMHDLEARGLLDETLLVFAGEFGRTPFAQGADGRDHNPQGFSIWMAGGGVKGGMAHGATDEWGYRAVQDKVEIHDLHATMLHLVGIDHKRLTLRWGGRDMRLTDVHGEVVRNILA